MDIASGAVDLALESELLRERDRRAVAEAEASRLAAAAIERIDAQRTVRRETIGDARRGAAAVARASPSASPTSTARSTRSTSLIGAGIDLLRIEVPIGRELADRMIDAGVEVPEWRPRRRAATGRPTASPAEPGPDRQPAGARPGSARSADRAAARRRAYVRLATVVPALGAPEGAVVAAFERIDLIASDAMAEIVADAVEPDRALADHAFAHRLAERAGTAILVGAGAARRRAGPVGRRAVRPGDPRRSGPRAPVARASPWPVATGSPPTRSSSAPCRRG